MKHLQKDNVDTTFAYFDLTLSPTTAKNRGYEYIEDVIYDHNHPSAAMKDVLQFCKQFHCKLGKPNQETESFYGLYMPK
jgi:hypothetical protein